MMDNQPPRELTNEEKLSQQLLLHQKIQEQMRLQLELSKRITERSTSTGAAFLNSIPSTSTSAAAAPAAPAFARTPPPPPPPIAVPPANTLPKATTPAPIPLKSSPQMPKQSSSAPSVLPKARLDADLEDNLFDMLDDLLMIPSGGSLFGNPASNSQSTSQTGPRARSSSRGSDASGAGDESRDSLADVMEQLDLELDDFDVEDTQGFRTKQQQKEPIRFGSRITQESCNSYDGNAIEDDVNDLEAYMDHGIDDDDDDANDNLTGDDANDNLTGDDDQRGAYDEHAVSSRVVPRARLSSADMLASISSMQEGEFDNQCVLIWEDGLLGLRLRMSKSKSLPAVSKVTGKSSIFGIHLVEVGDLLLQIGSRRTCDMKFIDAVNYLKVVERPCQLVFRRVHADPMQVQPIQQPVKSAIALKLVQKFDELLNTEAEKAPSAPSVQLDAKYEVKWSDGPLGISLIASREVPFPLVTRVTGKAQSLQVQDVQPGHYLVQIGGYNTADGNFNSAIKYLQKVNKPVSLFFCPGMRGGSNPPQTGPDEYEHTWEKKQPLWFTVKAALDGRIVVADLGNAKSVKSKTNKDHISGNQIAMGDIVEWINGESTRDMNFHEALTKLRTAKRPLIVRFKRAPPQPSPRSHQLASGAVGGSSRNISPKPTSPANHSNGSKENNSSCSTPTKRGFNLKMIVSMTKDKEKDKEKENHLGALVKVIDLKKVFGKDNSSSVVSGSGRNGSPPSSGAANHGSNAQGVSQDGTDVEKRSNSSPPDRQPKADKGGNSHGHGKSHRAASKSTTEQHDIAVVKPRSNSGANPDGHAHSHNHASPHNGQTHASPRVGTGHGQRHPSPRGPPSHSSPHGAHGQSQNHASAHAAQGESPHANHVKHSEPSTAAENAQHPDEVELILNGTGIENDWYEVIWPEGSALGLTLRVHPTTRFPVVARVTGTSNLKNIDHVSAGDILFSANHVNLLPQQKFKQTLEALSHLSKPAVLHFRKARCLEQVLGRNLTAPAPIVTSNSPHATSGDQGLVRGPPLEANEYEFIWRENSNLGLVFSSDHEKPVVTKVDIDCGGPMLSRVNHGDVLTMIGNADITGRSFHNSMTTLRAIRRPVVLRFRRYPTTKTN